MPNLSGIQINEKDRIQSKINELTYRIQNPSGPFQSEKDIDRRERLQAQLAMTLSKR